MANNMTLSKKKKKAVVLPRFICHANVTSVLLSFVKTVLPVSRK